jgi:hypothetical protein
MFTFFQFNWILPLHSNSVAFVSSFPDPVGLPDLVFVSSKPSFYDSEVWKNPDVPYEYDQICRLTMYDLYSFLSWAKS